ncbi:hypothetical protein Pmani_030637 [Petrolisthes manimaculis]|uniref:CUB domain-containing protein n=1 Tax=Petrolisthes manimaculis TaxID=1843537 RepID=A0AAE1TVQ2_9EUCA|nr:hypothetical protein Pmani_030637 [Petrolisthes manimaculis]
MCDLTSRTKTLLLLLLFLLASSPPFSGGEVAESCTETPLEFKCGAGEAAGGGGPVLVVREAWIYASMRLDPDSLPRCHVQEYNLEYKAGSFLQYINKQCGGQTECKFELQKHTDLQRREDLKKYRRGALRVVYDCVKKTDFHRVCGSEVNSQKGWVQSVGYPLYYLGDPVCTITLRVDEGQHIQITLTDISLREDAQPGNKGCRDSIKIQENGTELLEKCGVTNVPITVTSKGPVLNVTLTATSKLFPKRGFLGHFKALGCQTPLAPADGYMSYRNATHAEFWCCVHHAFSDTMTRRRVLECGDRTQTWNDTLPDCVDLEELLAGGNITESQYQNLVNGTTVLAQAERLRQAHIVYDLVVPAVIMSVLVLGNAAVVFLIIYCRKQGRGKKYEEGHEEAGEGRQEGESSFIIHPDSHQHI